jgi:hypothetical protein
MFVERRSCQAARRVCKFQFVVDGASLVSEIRIEPKNGSTQQPFALYQSALPRT